VYKLYKITNKINKKSYIGITKLPLDTRFSQHIRASQSPKYPINRAIKKYGPKNFVIELLAESSDKSVISNLEEPTVLKYNSRKNGYNVAIGGFGGNLGEAANLKRISTRAAWSPEFKKQLSEQQRLRQLGKTKHNNAGRAAQSEKVKGNQFAKGLVHSAETRQIISNANKYKRSTETRQKMSQSAIINHNGSRFSGRRASCLCCKKEWDIGNFTQHIKRTKK